MSRSLLTRIPVPVRFGALVAVALTAAACGSSGGSSSSTGAQAGASASGAAMVITTKAGSAGTFLTDGSGRTVYLWAKDGTGSSACSGACTALWPPVTTSGSPTASGSAKASDLGTITRSGGAKQVTYDGHPLYYYAGDSSSGQTNGQGTDSFGAKWWLVAPAGTSITTTGGGTAPSTSTSPSAGGGWS
jgi:predicted lipoprotein with Yx(FWY)xxD motif